MISKRHITAIILLALTFTATAQQRSPRHAIAGPDNSWTIMHDGTRQDCPICNPTTKTEAKDTKATPSAPKKTEAKDTKPQQQRWKQTEDSIKAENVRKANPDPATARYQGRLLNVKDATAPYGVRVYVWDPNAKRYRSDTQAAVEINDRRRKAQEEAEKREAKRQNERAKEQDIYNRRHTRSAKAEKREQKKASTTAKPQKK